MDRVWIVMSLEEYEPHLHKQPTPTAFVSRHAALRTCLGNFMTDIDEDEDLAEQRANIASLIRQLKHDGCCHTPDGWFVSLTEESVQN